MLIRVTADSVAAFMSRNTSNPLGDIVNSKDIKPVPYRTIFSQAGLKMRWTILLHATGALLLATMTPTSAEPPLAPRIARRHHSRLGSNYTAIPILRTLGGTNVVDIGIGGRGAGYLTQPMNLTLSTSLVEIRTGW